MSTIITSELKRQLARRDATTNAIIWETDPDWQPLPWTNVPILDDIPKPLPPLNIRSRNQPKPRKRFSCAACNKKYARRPDANIHALEAHLGFFRFQCRECDFRTSRNYHLTKHISKTSHRPWNILQAHRVKPHYRYTATPAPVQQQQEQQIITSAPPATPTTPTTPVTPFVDTFSPISPELL